MSKLGEINAGCGCTLDCYYIIEMLCPVLYKEYDKTTLRYSNSACEYKWVRATLMFRCWYAQLLLNIAGAC
jgi:hypothetical protein